ncbi:teichoic acid transport system ATP-binding protein [Paenibacillus castaneae]|uniref:ABC transporter ATP-binding protein n=1 Tax=Paenibacillus castaneae TaxID=474957 RepID=UPI000C9B4D31|nr:ABC transporter ATP-binding protein [Paenibacillus castaneae]NIK78352.1 teichoic acid transport system ATP-binding protein [Paenibacillus castaneae]
MSEISIQLNNISKKYKLYSKPIDRVQESILGKKKHVEFIALKDVSLSIKKGETLGIIGENGSGKSTLLKIISGVLTESSGTKKVEGHVAALLELGTGFNMEYTGYENIFLNGTMRGFTKDQMNEKLKQIIDFADIGDFINRPVKTYSSGMFARLAFSVMISFKPEILIVDEALSVGDVFFQQKCNRYMKENMDDVTKILVSHDLSSIASMADNVLVLSRGEVVFYGEPLKAIEFYTKRVHSKVFQSNSELNSDDLIQITASIDDTNWTAIDKEALGGAGEVVIKSIKFMVNGEEYKGYVTKESIVEINMRIACFKETTELIFGYLVNDKYGNAIFGENTLSSNLKVGKIEANKEYLVKMYLNWPEIQENDYFITLGIGEGFHELQHTIQCWAHNIIQVKNITTETVHAIFNNKIKEISIEKIK